MPAARAAVALCARSARRRWSDRLDHAIPQGGVTLSPAADVALAAHPQRKLAILPNEDADAGDLL
jgi:hypothetical protein